MTMYNELALIVTLFNKVKTWKCNTTAKLSGLFFVLISTCISIFKLINLIKVTVNQFYTNSIVLIVENTAS